MSISERDGVTASSCCKTACSGTTRCVHFTEALLTSDHIQVHRLLLTLHEWRFTQVFGETRVNVHALFEQLRREGDLTLIGAEAAISENKWKRFVKPAQ